MKRRARHFIDRKVQGALIVRMFQHWVLFMFGTLALLGCLEVLMSDFKRPLSGHLGNVWNRYQPFFIVSFLMLPAFINDMIKLSHRFVGPVARVRAELRCLAQGKPAAEIRLRKKDFWCGLATDFNQALARIRSDAQAARGESIACNAPFSHYDASQRVEDELQPCG